MNLRFTKVNESVSKTVDDLIKDIKQVMDKASEVDGLYKGYFIQTGSYLSLLFEHYKEIQAPQYFEGTFESLLENNHKLYEDVTEPGYKTSYVNPTYACGVLGKAMGQFLSAIAYRFRTGVGLVYEGRLYELSTLVELYVMMFNKIVLEKEEDRRVLDLMYRDFMIAHMEVKAGNEWYRRLSSEFDVYSRIVDSYDLTDLRYLFRYGMYVGTNELALAKYVLSLDEAKKQTIADTYTEAYVRGFERGNIPLTHKKSVQVVYHLGFESIVKKAYKNFEKLGLKPFAYYHLREIQRPRLYNTRPNKQMVYDHRFSDAMLLDEVYVEAAIAAASKALAGFSEEGRVFSGLALFEVFGDTPFNPVNSEDTMVYDQREADLTAQMQKAITLEYRKCVPGDAYSFTINDYPLPSIGKDFEAIFDATIQVNTLDEGMYLEVQGTMIDALDQSDYVTVTGRNGNETNITVALQDISDPQKQTKFDNCTADVNVPVGEVYTSPKLKGTEGLLHVQEVYLKGLMYKELKIWFKEGMIVDYDCKNFDTEAENKAFVKETLMHPHDTLPLGEFAIGTNTVAYMMAQKYNIQALLPILIGEKTGPHFAVGDTCFAWAEDSPVYNPNGKEMMARYNEKTISRKDGGTDAYTYCHTDITIPYNELDKITGHNKSGETFEIIDAGRFVLSGTEVLNKAFDEGL